MVAQQGQVFKLRTTPVNGDALWAYRYRLGGRDARRVQRGGLRSEQDAAEELARALERLRRSNGTAAALTLAELVDDYLAQHDAQPETIEKLRWLLQKATRAFGEFQLGELSSQEIAAWRMTIPSGHRFETTQALRQVLAQAVAWRMIDVNPAKHGVDNPQRRRTEKRPFESWTQLAEVAAQLVDPAGPMVIFAAATGLRPGMDRSSGATSTVKHASSTYGARSATARSSAPRRKEASARSRYRRSPSKRSSSYQSVRRRTWCSRRCGVATSICTTSADAPGCPHNARSGSRRCVGSTIFATRSPPSHSVPASQPSISPATWAPA